MFFFFFNDTATTEIYTLSLHDALPISFDNAKAELGSLGLNLFAHVFAHVERAEGLGRRDTGVLGGEHEREQRSEEHTSELQSQSNLVCRLLLEKKQPAAPMADTHSHPR